MASEYLWQWHFGGQKFQSFSVVNNYEINDGVSKGTSKIHIDVSIGTRKQGYIIDVDKMVQVNEDTGYERCVRCGVGDAQDDSVYWFWMVDDSNKLLCGLPPSVCQQLEAGNNQAMVNVQGRRFQLDSLHEIVGTGRDVQKYALHRIKVDGVRAGSVQPVQSSQANNTDGAKRPTRSTRSSANSAASHAPSATSRKRKQVNGGEAAAAPANSSSDASAGKAKKTKVSAAGDAKTSDAAADAANTSSKKKGPSKTKKTASARGDGQVVVKVDRQCPLESRADVYIEGGDIYDATLNQTNIGNNNNKYYLLQLLREGAASPGRYHVWFRWGRVGYPGQTSLLACGTDLSKAKTTFTKKFSDKTKNDFSSRHKFVKQPGKYDLVLTDYSAPDDEDEKAGDVVDAKHLASGKSTPPPACDLDKRIQDLMELIYDKRLFESSVADMEYDVKKAPLGKLTEQQVKNGYAALNEIANLISASQTGGRNLQEACSTFYTRIPHNFGMRTPPLISTTAEVKRKMELLDALSNIEVAVHNISAAAAVGEVQKHPITRNYDLLECEMTPVESGSGEYKVVERYLSDTHAPTHNNYTMCLQQLFSLDKHSEGARFTDLGNRHLLWHGSRLTNYAGILCKGLRIAPPEAPSTGYMFGKGVYFADRSSKSANYCFTTPSKNVGLLLLCEVALGTCNELTQAKYDANKLPTGKHSTLGKGMMVPQSHQGMLTDSTCQIPIGKTVKRTDSSEWLALQYNEYCVYHLAQIKLRYLLKVNFNYK